MPVYKNKASQKVPCLAYNSTTGAKVTGDAANITAQISLDGGASAATNDTNPTELDATDHPGIYLFDLTQAETNADMLVISPVSATSGVAIEPLLIFTEPETRQADVALWRGTQPDTLSTGLVQAYLSGFDPAIGDTGPVPATVNGYATGQSPADLVDLSGLAEKTDLPTNFADLAVTATTGKVTVGTNDDKTGYSLSVTPPTAAAIADAVWDEPRSGHTTAGTFGLYLDAQVSTVGGGSLTAADIADAVWDETLADHLTAGSTGASLNAAGSAGDPWTTTLPGSYTGSQAGKILADILTDTGTTIPGTLSDIQGATFDTATDSLEAIRNRGDAAWITATGFSTLDAEGVRSAVGLASANLDTQLADLPTVAEFEARTLAAAAYFDPAADAVTVGTNNDKTGYALASAPPTASAIASQVRTELTTELARIDAAISTRSTYAGADTSGTTTLLSRLTSTRAGYLDSLNTGVPLDLTQTGITFRDVSAVGEASVTVADCFAAAFVQAAGGEAVVGTAYTKKRPAGTAFRTFTLDDGTTPTSRT